jgi:eukaryotic-like serine/threonine-protein kinase
MAPLGTGGMSEVWRAVHRDQRLQVAVKVLSPNLARTPLFEAVFRRELEAIASLDHPSIVMVLDYGIVPEASARSSGGLVVAGSPYLVLELAGGGTLRHALRRRPPSWEECRALLLTLLGALAHAHAHGIIHRDLKPGNILWFDDPHHAGWKLTDFGVAHATSELLVDEREQSAGTPAYMSPEQIRGTWRDMGPWTDMYGLACVAYEVVCGRRPFTSQDPLDVVDAQLHHAFPALLPIIDVPDGFGDWVSRMSHKSPRARFRHAADAAWNLLMLGNPAPRRELPPRLPSWHGVEAGAIDQRDIPTSASLDPVTEILSERHGHTPGLSDETAAAQFPVNILAPLPASWRPSTPSTQDLKLRLLGAGLGLWGVRTIPFVGREAERDKLWGALAMVRRTGRARAVLVGGEAGIGKTRLAAWMATRAAEVGAATVLRATHSQEGGTGDGLARMAERHLRTARLRAEKLTLRVRDLLRALGGTQPWEYTELGDWLEQRTAPSQASLPRWERPSQRYGPLANLVEKTAHERPVVLVIDDAQYGADALAFCEFMLARQEQRASTLLFVITANPSLLADNPAARHRLEVLASRPDTETLDLTPLGRRDMTALVGALLVMDDAAERRVLDRAKGNPAYAVQTVGGWVDRGLLAPSGEGLVLHGEAPSVPGGLREAWTQRIREFLVGRHEDDDRALQLAAVFGRDIADAEWEEGPRAHGLRPSLDLVDRLIDARLAGRTEEGWCFASDLLRACVLTRARGPQWRSLHATASSVIAATSAGRRGEAHRRARHLVEAGRVEEAIAPLTDAAIERWGQGEYSAALAMLAHREHLLATVADGRPDVRVCEGWVLQSCMHRHRGELGEAEGWIEQALKAATRHGWREQLGRALMENGYLRSQRGGMEDARENFAGALALFEEVDAAQAMADAMLGLGGVAYRQGDRDGAHTWYEDARARFERLGVEVGLARCCRGLAEVAQSRGEYDDALALYRRAMDLHEHHGNRFLWLTTLNGVAELNRLQGRFDEAEAEYRRILETLESMGSLEVNVMRINIALTRLGAGDYAVAQGMFAQVLSAVEEAGQEALAAGVHAGLLACAAAMGDWPAFDAHLRHTTALHHSSRSADADDARSVDLAAELARTAGQTGRAGSAEALAAILWKILA